MKSQAKLKNEVADPGRKEMGPARARRSDLSPHSVPDWPRVLPGLPQEIPSPPEHLTAFRKAGVLPA